MSLFRLVTSLTWLILEQSKFLGIQTHCLFSFGHHDQLWQNLIRKRTMIWNILPYDFTLMLMLICFWDAKFPINWIFCGSFLIFDIEFVELFKSITSTGGTNESVKRAWREPAGLSTDLKEMKFSSAYWAQEIWLPEAFPATTISPSFYQCNYFSLVHLGV